MMHFTRMLPRLCLLCAMVCLLHGCSDPEYDLSSPEIALNSMQQMIEDGNARSLASVIHIPARDIAFADGVTEASAINDVMQKTADLLGQLHRVSTKLRDRYPDEIGVEIETARGAMGAIYLGFLEEPMARFLADPFAFLRDQRERLATIDLGDGSAAVMWDGEPAFGGIGLAMREVDGEWKFELPIDMPPISEFRPETREEWAVIASMMLGFENALNDFEDRLDAGKFGSLADASGEAGRMIGASAIVQGAIYAFMKQKAAEDS
ncbi:MAG: hypothetical protein ACR2GY_02250 [Phycisphaerales bacterium]